MYVGRDDPYLENIYLGVSVLLLAAGGLLAGIRGSGRVLAVCILSVLVASGDHTPLARVLYDSHLFQQIRYPEKFLLAAAFALAVFSAIVLDRILYGDRRVARTVFGLSVAWLAVSSVFLFSFAAATPDTRLYFAVNAARAAAACGIFAARRSRRDVTILLIGSAIVIADAVYSTSNVVPRMPVRYFAPPPIARAAVSVLGHSTRLFQEAGWMWRFGEPTARAFLNEGFGPRFWWLFRNGMFPNVPVTYGIPLVSEEDIDLTSLLNTDELREAFKVARLRPDPASVEAYLRLTNAGARLRFPELDTELREKLGRYPEQTSPVELVPSAAVPRYWFARRIERVTDQYDFRAAVYRLRAQDGVAFLNLLPFTPAPGAVSHVDEHTNAVRIDVNASGRALLVITITAHKYWRATIDGRPTTLLPANLAFQAVIVRAGSHCVELRYSNPLFAVGAVITLSTIFALVALSLREVLSIRRSPKSRF